MSVTLSDLLTILRTDTLRDINATQKWGDAQLTRFLNAGIRSVFPSGYVQATDSTSTTTSQTASLGTYVDYEYDLPAAILQYHRPQTGNLISVEVGPIGGQRISDDATWTDRYRTLRGRPALGHAWEVDWGRRVLKVARGIVLPYDTGGTYRHYLRFRYVRPPAQLVSSSDTLELPDSFVQVLIEHARYLAYRSLQRSALSDSERFGNLGNVSQQSLEVDELIRRRGVRMPWPQCQR